MIQKNYIYRPRTLCNMTTYNYHYERLNTNVIWLRNYKPLMRYRCWEVEKALHVHVVSRMPGSKKRRLTVDSCIERDVWVANNKSVKFVYLYKYGTRFVYCSTSTTSAPARTLPIWTFPRDPNIFLCHG